MKCSEKNGKRGKGGGRGRGSGRSRCFPLWHAGAAGQGPGSAWMPNTDSLHSSPTAVIICCVSFIRPDKPLKREFLSPVFFKRGNGVQAWQCPSRLHSWEVAPHVIGLRLILTSHSPRPFPSFKVAAPPALNHLPGSLLTVRSQQKHAPSSKPFAAHHEAQLL